MIDENCFNQRIEGLSRPAHPFLCPHGFSGFAGTCHFAKEGSRAARAEPEKLLDETNAFSAMYHP